MAKTFVLTVVRHGQTEANADRLIHGQTDTSLNAMGVRQGHAAGQSLKATPFDKAFMQRAKNTCSYIMDENNKSSKVSSNDIIEDELLRERHFGEFENCYFSGTMAMTKGKLIMDMTYKPNGGESDKDVRDRAQTFLNVIIVYPFLNHE